MNFGNIERKYIIVVVVLLVFIINISVLKIISTKRTDKYFPHVYIAAVKTAKINKPKDYDAQIKQIKDLMKDITIDENSVKYDESKRIKRFETNNGYCSIKYYDDGSFLIKEFDINQLLQKSVQKSADNIISEENFYYDKIGNEIRHSQKIQLRSNEKIQYFSNIEIVNRLKNSNTLEYMQNKNDGTYNIKGSNLEIYPAEYQGIISIKEESDTRTINLTKPLKNISVEGNHNRIYGSDGNDSISVSGNYNVIDLKKGKDTLYISGKNNTVKNVEKKILK